MDLSKYRQLYVSETQENLEEAARRLVELEKTPDDRDHIDTVFRLFHSIKGMSGTMGYTPVFELAHQLEDLMDKVRRSSRRVDAAIIDVLLAGTDRMVRWVGDVEADRPLGQDAATAELKAQISRMVETAPPTMAQRSNTGAVALIERQKGDLIIELHAAESVADPAMRGFVLYRRLGGIGTVVGSAPSMETLRAGRLDGPLTLVLRCPHPADKVARFIRLAPEWEDVEVIVYDPATDRAVPPASPAPEPTTGAVGFGLSLDDDFDDDDDDLDLLLDLGDAPATPAAAAEPAVEAFSASEISVDSLADDFAEFMSGPAPDGSASTPDAPSGYVPVTIPPEPEPEPEPAARAPEPAAIVRARPARTIRVRTDWLDTLLDTVGDLLIVSQRMWAVDQEQPRPQMTRLLGEMSRLLGSLHGEALSVRMTPMSVLTDRLPRVVRDLCRQVGKQASLVVRGDDQRVDRAIIEGLDAPLTHMLRNAVEHGLEPPAMRVERHKPAAGLLVLECRRERDEIVVELRDDGKGIDGRHLAARAVRMGLIEQERATVLAERDLVRLVCLPGLSSRDQAGHLAGRGVGMDAVNEAVSALGGRVELESTIGEGTVIRLRLPRTPGISRLLLVEVAGQVYGLPLNHVGRTGLFAPEDTTIDADGHPVTADDEALPVWRLGELLGDADPIGGRRPGVVIGAGRRPGVLLVDRIVGQQDALLKPLGPLLEQIGGLSGVTLDARGQPVFVLDVPRLVRGAEPAAEAPATETQGDAPTR